MILDRLSDEIIIQVLHFCNYKAIVRFAATCKRNHQIVKNSVSLQLHIELEINGLEITSESSKKNATHASILDELRRYRDAWLHLNLSLPTKLPVEVPTEIFLWELRDGIYAGAFPATVDEESSENFPISLQIFPLGFVDQPPPLNFFQFHEFTLDIKQEVALLVVAADNQSINRGQAEIHLRSTTTGLPHPLAQHSTLTIEVDFWIPFAKHSSMVAEIMKHIIVVMFANADLQMYEILVWDWISGTLIHRIASRNGICSFFLLDQEHLVVYSAAHGAKNRPLEYLTLSVYTISTLLSNQNAPPPATFHIGSYPILAPTLILQFPKLHESYFVFPEGLLLRSFPTPGREMHTGSVTFSCSHAMTLNLALPLRRFPNTHNEEALTFRIFVNASHLLGYLDKYTHSNATVLTWDEWGERSTRWFIEKEYDELDDWMYVMSGSRYVTVEKQTLSVLDFNPLVINQHPNRVSSSEHGPPWSLEVDIDRDLVLEGKSLIRSPPLSIVLDQQPNMNPMAGAPVYSATISGDIPTTINSGFVEPVVSRLPFRIATRVQQVPWPEGWVIGGNYIIGMDGFYAELLVYKLQLSGMD